MLLRWHGPRLHVCITTHLQCSGKRRCTANPPVVPAAFLPCALNTHHGPPAGRRGKNAGALPPSPGWKESMREDTQCQATVYKTWQAALHGRRRLSMARRPQTRHALSVPQHECASSARRKTYSRSAYEGRRLLRAPVNGVRRRAPGPAAGPKPGLLADFHKTQKTMSPGLPVGLRRRKSQRRARETLVSV